MAWGIFKKIKESVKKAAKWVRDNAEKVAKPLLNIASKAGTTIGTAIGASTGNAAAGAKAGATVQNLAANLQRGLGWG